MEWEVAAFAEVAEYLGVSKQRAHQLMQRDDFPAPMAFLSVGRIWRSSDIRKWAAKRPGRIAEDERK